MIDNQEFELRTGTRALEILEHARAQKGAANAEAVLRPWGLRPVDVSSMPPFLISFLSEY